MYGGSNLYPLLLTVVPNLDPSISKTLVTTVAGSPESGRTTRGPEPSGQKQQLNMQVVMHTSLGWEGTCRPCSYFAHAGRHRLQVVVVGCFFFFFFFHNR